MPHAASPTNLSPPRTPMQTLVQAMGGAKDSELWKVWQQIEELEGQIGGIQALPEGHPDHTQLPGLQARLTDLHNWFKILCQGEHLDASGLDAALCDTLKRVVAHAWLQPSLRPACAE